MRPIMDRDGVQARDARPEDADFNQLMNARLRGAAGRGPAMIPHMQGHRPHPPLAEAIALVEDGATREGVALALRGNEPDPAAVRFAKDVLAAKLRAKALEEAGYEPVAAILSLTVSPGSAVRDAAALTLLELDGPGDAADAGRLLTAEGEDLADLINRLRVRAGLQPLDWQDGETLLD